MPRLFVNAMADFVIQNGMVSFTLADHSLRTEGKGLVPNPPEDVARIVMREADFAALMSFLNQRVDEFESKNGRKLGTGEDRA